jgi:hypothetical protein
MVAAEAERHVNAHADGAARTRAPASEWNGNRSLRFGAGAGLALRLAGGSAGKARGARPRRRAKLQRQGDATMRRLSVASDERGACAAAPASRPLSARARECLPDMLGAESAQRLRRLRRVVGLPQVPRRVAGLRGDMAEKEPRDPAVSRQRLERLTRENAELHEELEALGSAGSKGRRARGCAGGARLPGRRADLEAAPSRLAARDRARREVAAVLGRRPAPARARSLRVPPRARARGRARRGGRTRPRCSRRSRTGR